MSENLPRMVYFISELDRTPDGGFIPCIAVEGETGYHRTDWVWGKDIKLAQEIADERNRTMDIDPVEAMKIVFSTMNI